jgi:2-polyprenyl-6-methoxyphenol hydroxylase-like FAD-dependent oxidoreductase
MTLPVSIIGGGVAGCVLARALGKQAIDSRIFERNGPSRFTGGALLLWSNAMRALAEVGLDVGPRTFGQELECIDFRSSDGQLLWRLRADKLARHNDAPCMVVPRAAFLDYLDKAVAGQVERQVYRSHRQTAQQVTTSFEGGNSVESSVLIGADGLRSLVRRELEGREPVLRFTGQSIWVGALPFRHRLLKPGRAVASVGRGLRFWAAAFPDERVYWYAIFPEHFAPKNLFELSRHFVDFHPPVAELIQSTPLSSVAKTSICDRHPSASWGSGRVTLIGDAIHPVTPDLGQGACQAIESAVTLAEQLAQHGSSPAGLRHYEERRRTRTSRISNLSYITAVNSMVKSPLACRLRNLGIATLLPFVAAPQLRWITRGRHVD